MLIFLNLCKEEEDTQSKGDLSNDTNKIISCVLTVHFRHQTKFAIIYERQSDFSKKYVVKFIFSASLNLNNTSLHITYFADVVTEFSFSPLNS